MVYRYNDGGMDGVKGFWRPYLLFMFTIAMLIDMAVSAFRASTASRQVRQNRLGDGFFEELERQIWTEDELSRLKP